MPATTKGAWKLQEVRDALLKGEWITYDTLSDPGSLWAWGSNSCGELGDGTRSYRESPVQIPGTSWTKVGRNSAALKSNGTLWSWGTNGTTGAVGDNSFADGRSSPVQIPGTSWKFVAGGTDDPFKMATKTDGTLWVWGSNFYGQLGLNDRTTRCSPIQIPGTSWNNISDNDPGATKSDGTLWMWGSNTFGRLGVNDTVQTSSPVQVPGTTWNKIQSASLLASIATKTDDTLWSWGYNGYGVLGDGTRIDRSSPVQIPGTSWSDIELGCDHALAKKTDGTLWAWGRNQFGQLGNNFQVAFSEAPRSSPVQIPGNNWNIIAAGVLISAATKTDGTLWIWGYNNQGRLGDGTRTYRSSPVQIPGTSWFDVQQGSVTFARKTS